MSTPPNLLNDDGSASMATMFMMSHHAFRRDLARFEAALANAAKGDNSRVRELAGEWQWFRGALHGHHMMEDTHVFPGMASAHPEIAPTIERLSADHHRIDPMLERGDAAFSGAVDVAAAERVVSEIARLLDTHLAIEEAEIVPFLRNENTFPTPGSDAEADQYAQGFAWSLHGIHPEVVEQVRALLPEALTSRLPAARRSFDERCVRVWGSAEAGASRTPVPGR